MIHNDLGFHGILNVPITSVTTFLSLCAVLRQGQTRPGKAARGYIYIASVLMMLHHGEFLHSRVGIGPGPEHLQTQNTRPIYEALFLSVTQARTLESWLLFAF